MHKLFLMMCLLALPLMLFGQTEFKIIGEPEKIAGGNGADYFMNPVWSPDGSKIAFTSANYQGLWVIRSDGSELKQLSADGGVGFEFAWAPDSRQIAARAIQYDKAFRLNAIKLFSVDDGSIEEITEFLREKCSTPQWSVDKTELFFMHGDQLKTIQTGEKLDATFQARVLLSGQNQVYSGERAVNMQPMVGFNKDKRYLNVRISPDGSKISYEKMGGNLYVSNTDGNRKVDLGKGFRARWSPDSRYLVYMISEDDGHQITRSDLYITNPDGSLKIQLTDSRDLLEMNPSWSADSKRIAFSTYKDGAIYIARIAE